MIAPSGDQFEIAFGDQRAVIVEVGGGLRTYAAGSREVLDGYGADEMCTSGRGQVLAPWPNRIEDGAYEFEGCGHQLALDEPANRNAIHGLVRWSAWTTVEREPHRVVMQHTLHPQPGYPFKLALSIEYALSDVGLSARTEARNIGTTSLPYGTGMHPYLAVWPPSIDTCVLHVPADVVCESDGRGIPTGSRPVDGTEYDFRQPRPIGATRLDHCFTQLARTTDGLAQISLVDPGSGVGTTVWLDQAYQYVMVFSGDPIPDVNRRSLAVEPMTCAPNAFRSGEGLVVLEPGESLTAAWGIRAIIDQEGGCYG